MKRREMKTKSLKILFVLFLLRSLAFAQSDFEINGYFQNLQTVWQPEKLDYLYLNGSLVNRINFKFYYGENFTFNAGLRNIIDYGNFHTLFPTYAALLTEEDGYLNLTKLWTDKSSYTFYSQLDRLNILWSYGNFELQAGRQRINLGMNMVWTPNDIFNSASYLNFSYVEKHGSDAIRAQYYFGYASSIEFIYKLDAQENVTAVGVLHLNNWDYDFQFLAGETSQDYVLGTGWAGSVSDAGFYGEATYFRDKEKKDTTGVLVAAISGNYTFSNSLFIHFEALYNSAGKTENISWNGLFFGQKYNAKNLSPSRYSLFAEISYPLTPLIKIDFPVIFNPLDYSYFLGPNVDFSFTDNIDLLVLSQLFFGNDNTEWGDFGSYYFAQLKWNF